MKPHIICHMGSSIDGRIVPTHWPQAVRDQMGDVYEEIHRSLEGDAWIVGRVTMAEFGKGEPRPATATEAFPRTTWKAPGAEKGPYAIAIDQQAKLHLNTKEANGDALVVVLVESVSDNHLAELRRDGISYVFAGRSELDLALAVETLASDFGIKTLLLEGGGGINGSFLDAGLIDEISLLLIPVADGHADVPSTFHGVTGKGRHLSLQSVDRLDNDTVHLRYRVA